MNLELRIQNAARLTRRKSKWEFRIIIIKTSENIFCHFDPDKVGGEIFDPVKNSIFTVIIQKTLLKNMFTPLKFKISVEELKT